MVRTKSTLAISATVFIMGQNGMELAAEYSAPVPLQDGNQASMPAPVADGVSF